FDFTRRTLTRPVVRKFLRETLEEYLFVDPELARELGFEGDKIKELSETQFMLLLDTNPELWDELESYLNEVPPNASDGSETDTQRQLRESWKEKFKRILTNPELMAEFRRINNPLEPYTLAPKDGSPAYTKRTLFINHE